MRLKNRRHVEQNCCPSFYLALGLWPVNGINVNQCPFLGGSFGKPVDHTKSFHFMFLVARS